MTDKQWRSLGKYLRRLADMMALRDWTLELSHQPDEGDTLASISTTFGRKVAVIQVCANWPNLDPEVQRHALVHELIHAHLSGARDLVYRSLPTLLGEAGWSAFESAYRQQNEHATDGVADAIGSCFPLWEG